MLKKLELQIGKSKVCTCYEKLVGIIKTDLGKNHYEFCSAKWRILIDFKFNLKKVASLTGHFYSGNPTVAEITSYGKMVNIWEQMCSHSINSMKFSFAVW